MTNYEEMPEWSLKSLEEYVSIGRYPGQFLEAVLAHELFNAISRADDESREFLPMYVKWIYNRAPMGCHGSYKKVEEWMNEKRK